MSTPMWDIPEHSPIEINEQGQGPTDPDEAVLTVCWCCNPRCTKFYGLPLHRTEAGYPHCSTCDGGGCPDCTDPA